LLVLVLLPTVIGISAIGLGVHLRLVIVTAGGEPVLRWRRGRVILLRRRSPTAPRIAGGDITRPGYLPVARRGRGSVVRLSRRPIAAPQFGKRIALPQQTGKLGQRIASVCLLVRRCRLGRAPIGIIGAIGS